MFLVDVSTAWHVAYVQVKKELEKLKKPNRKQGPCEKKFPS